MNEIEKEREREKKEAEERNDKRGRNKRIINNGRYSGAQFLVLSHNRRGIVESRHFSHRHSTGFPCRHPDGFRARYLLHVSWKWKRRSLVQVEATGESLFYTVAPASRGRSTPQEMDKDLPAGRVKIDRPVVPFRGKFIGCPYRSLLCPTYALTKSGGKFYKWNSSGFARGVPSVRGNLSTWLSRSSLCVTGFFLYGENTETERRTMGSSRLFGLVVSKYIREEIFEFRYFLSFFDFFRLFTRYPRLSKAVEY